MNIRPKLSASVANQAVFPIATIKKMPILKKKLDFTCSIEYKLTVREADLPEEGLLLGPFWGGDVPRASLLMISRRPSVGRSDT